MGPVWARLEGGYDRAYAATGVRNYVETFFEGVIEADLTAIARHFGQAARDVAGGETSVVLDDDVAPDVDAAEFPHSGEEGGDIPDF